MAVIRDGIRSDDREHDPARPTAASNEHGPGTRWRILDGRRGSARRRDANVAGAGDRGLAAHPSRRLRGRLLDGQDGSHASAALEAFCEGDPDTSPWPNARRGEDLPGAPPKTRSPLASRSLAADHAVPLDNHFRWLGVRHGADRASPGRSRERPERPSNLPSWHAPMKTSSLCAMGRQTNPD